MRRAPRVGWKERASERGREGARPSARPGQGPRPAPAPAPPGCCAPQAPLLRPGACLRARGLRTRVSARSGSLPPQSSPFLRAAATPPAPRHAPAIVSRCRLAGTRLILGTRPFASAEPASPRSAYSPAFLLRWGSPPPASGGHPFTEVCVFFSGRLRASCAPHPGPAFLPLPWASPPPARSRYTVRN